MFTTSLRLPYLLRRQTKFSISLEECAKNIGRAVIGHLQMLASNHAYRERKSISLKVLDESHKFSVAMISGILSSLELPGCIQDHRLFFDLLALDLYGWVRRNKKASQDVGIEINTRDGILWIHGRFINKDYLC